MATKLIILVVNPGSASRKYSLFQGSRCLASLHFEHKNDQIVCTLSVNGEHREFQTGLDNIDRAVGVAVTTFRDHNILTDQEHIGAIGLRIVAPSSYFLEDRELTEEATSKLESLMSRAPLHITASLKELHKLRRLYPYIPIYGISDSAFHATKPDFAWNYGLPLQDADRLDIKRFGYHGLAVASAIRQLHKSGKLTPKTVVVHLGSGASVTAVHLGRSVDNTMGYSPLEGLIMATRSGSIDVLAVQTLQTELGLTNHQLDEYLNRSSGLLGLGGSADLRELLDRESGGDNSARLALNTYVYNIQKAIGAMTAALGGIDQLVFTGTVGERSEPIRRQVAHRLGYFDLFVDSQTNKSCVNPDEPTLISRLAHSKPIFVVPIDEAAEMARHVQVLIG